MKCCYSCRRPIRFGGGQYGSQWFHTPCVNKFLAEQSKVLASLGGRAEKSPACRFVAVPATVSPLRPEEDTRAPILSIL